ncbi:MAG TPA: amidohydrolase family protein [Chloroflexota bacterium]|nr:amidohydrolase family protein [Chloroflexota bacterium]
MILIDAHVSVSTVRHRADAVLKALKRFDTDSAIIFADSQSPDLAAENRYVLRSAQEFDCFPLYYLGGNPYTDTRMDLELPDSLEEYAGIRWHRWFGESRDLTGRVDRHELEFAVVQMETTEFESLMSALHYYDLPILLEEDFAVTLEFVERYGEMVKVIIPHMGMFSGGVDLVVGRLYRNPNIYFTTSYAPLDPVLVSRIGAERLLYASDYPYGDPAQNIEKIKHLDLSDEDEALIFGENVERLLHRDVEDLDPYAAG